LQPPGLLFSSLSALYRKSNTAVTNGQEADPLLRVLYAVVQDQKYLYSVRGLLCARGTLFPILHNYLHCRGTLLEIMAYYFVLVCLLVVAVRAQLSSLPQCAVGSNSYKFSLH